MSEEKIANSIDLETTRALTLHRAGANAFSIAPTNMRDLLEFAKLMAVSGPCIRPQFRNKPGSCLAIALQAFRNGADPYAAANQAYVTTSRSGEEQISYQAQYVHAVINNSGLLQRRLRPEYSGVGGKRKCIIRGFIKGDDEPFEYESPAIEDIAVKNSPLWRSDPDQQLFYYSTRAWARRHAPEISMGMYTPEEVTVIDAQASPAQMLDEFARIPKEAVHGILKETPAAAAPQPGPPDHPQPSVPQEDPVPPPQAAIAVGEATAEDWQAEMEVASDWLDGDLDGVIPETSPVIYSFADADGEVFEYDSPIEATEGFILLLQNAATREALDTVWEHSADLRKSVSGNGNLLTEMDVAWDQANLRLSREQQADTIEALSEECMAATKGGLREFHKWYLNLKPEKRDLVKPMRAHWEKLAKEARP